MQFLFLLLIFCAGIAFGVMVAAWRMIVVMRRTPKRNVITGDVRVEIGEGETLADAKTAYINDRLFISLDRFSEAMDEARNSVRAGDNLPA